MTRNNFFPSPQRVAYAWKCGNENEKSCHVREGMLILSLAILNSCKDITYMKISTSMVLNVLIVTIVITNTSLIL